MKLALLLLSLMACFPVGATCVPDDATYWTTANLAWAPVTANPHVDGHRIYWRVPPNILHTLGAIVPCRHAIDELTGEEIHEGQVCQGVILPGQADADVFAYPARRIGDWELIEVEFAVTAYNANGESLVLSAPIKVCMSPICRPGGMPCQ
jgi:hypothetical protein